MNVLGRRSEAQVSRSPHLPGFILTSGPAVASQSDTSCTLNPDLFFIKLLNRYFLYLNVFSKVPFLLSPFHVSSQPHLLAWLCRRGLFHYNALEADSWLSCLLRHECVCVRLSVRMCSSGMWEAEKALWPPHCECVILHACPH